MRRKDPPDSIAESIRKGRYQAQTISKAVLRTPGMISIEERKLLTFLAAQAWQPGTQIVDGGCFLGASTRALIDGLRRNPALDSGTRSIIHSYDLFTANEYMIRSHLAGSGLGAGDSYLALFKNQLHPDQNLVDVHAGNVRDTPWSGAPISILFLDMLWSWDINQFAIGNFYQSLCGEDAFLVHQDYVYAWYPWIPISMEYLSDCFEFVAYVPLASVVFRCTKLPDATTASLDLLRDLSPDQLMLLMSRALERFSGESRGILECSKGSLLRYLGRNDEARAHLRDVATRYRSYEAPPRFAKEILAHIESGQEARVV